MAWIGDTTPYESRQGVLARYLLGQIFGMTSGSVAGGFAAESGWWQWPFVAVAVAFLVVAWLLGRAAHPLLARARAVTWAGPDGPATPQLLPSGELRMRGCDVPWWKRLATYGTCSARYSIVMPNGRSLAATSDTGSVRARGAFDALALRTDVGDIISTGLSARTLRATVDVGEVNAVLTNTPDSVVARADVGSVTLTLPAGQYNIRATTDIGDVNVDASLSNPQSTRTIDVRVDVGDITIRVAR